MEVDAESVRWRTRRHAGQVPAAAVHRVVIAEVTCLAMNGPDILRRYALVLDADDVALLRVSAGVTGGRRGVEAAHRLRDLWAPLDVPVQTVAGAERPADCRRRWPEAFGFVASRPYWTATLAAAAYLVVVVPILDRVFGP